jgi:hypothetical protein
VFSPFPVHGLDPLLGLEESRLHQAGFIYGALGTMTAFLGMTGYLPKIGQIFLVVSHIGQFLPSFLLLLN